MKKRTKWVRGAEILVLVCLTVVLAVKLGAASAIHEQILKHAIVTNPADATAYYKLAHFYGKAGRYAEAIEAGKNAIRIKPDFAEGYCQLGSLYLAMDNQMRFARPGTVPDYMGETIDVIKKALAVGSGLKSSTLSEAYFTLGAAYSERRQHVEAVEAFKQAIEVEPGNCRAYFGLGLAYRDMGQNSEAIAALKQALVLDDHTLGKRFTGSTHGRLGYILAETGQHCEAVHHLQEAVRLIPKSTDGMVKLAWILATSPDAAARNPSLAIRYAERALDFDWPLALDTLAAAYASAGRFNDAVAMEQKAIAQKWGYPPEAEMQARLELYKNRKPYYEEPAGQHAQAETPSPRSTPVAVVAEGKP